MTLDRQLSGSGFGKKHFWSNDVTRIDKVKRHSGEMHWKRVHRMLNFASFVSAFLGIGWIVFSILIPNAIITALSLATLIMAGINIFLVRQGKIRLASYIYLAVIYLILFISASFLGVLHQFLMPLAICAFLLMRNEHRIIRHGTPIVCLITFGFFACLPTPTDSIYLLSAAVRETAIWIDQILAVLTLYICLQLAYEDVLEQSKIEMDLRDALIRNQLVLMYQPQVQSSGETVGVEALVRWMHPTRGLVPPNDFIPLAEATGLMVPIGEWVLRTACAQIALWQSTPHFNALTIAVNVSASQFADDQFVDRVLEILRETGAMPSMLKLELTESIFVANINDVVEKMVYLKRHGIRFSLDDFGTGFSSLSYLRRLPLDQLKIDQSFVRNMLGSSADVSIARTVITLGNDLNLEVIAEGVETQQHRKMLEEMGCKLFQGYLFSKPVSIVDVEEFASRERESDSSKQQHLLSKFGRGDRERWSKSRAANLETS